MPVWSFLEKDCMAVWFWAYQGSGGMVYHPKPSHAQPCMSPIPRHDVADDRLTFEKWRRQLCGLFPTVTVFLRIFSYNKLD